jgi:hypothetical protein
VSETWSYIVQRPVPARRLRRAYVDGSRAVSGRGPDGGHLMLQLSSASQLEVAASRRRFVLLPLS